MTEGSLQTALALRHGYKCRVVRVGGELNMMGKCRNVADIQTEHNEGVHHLWSQHACHGQWIWPFGRTIRTYGQAANKIVLQGMGRNGGTLDCTGEYMPIQYRMS